MQVSRRSLASLPVLLTLTLAACGQAPAGAPDAGASSHAQWARAQDLWRRRHPDAYAAWRAIGPPTSPDARAARARLADADRWYREGIRRVRQGEPDATGAIQEGSRIAPMDPELYLPLARACRDRGAVLRAAEFYKKFMLGAPTSADWPAARRELGPVAVIGELNFVDVLPKTRSGKIMRRVLRAVTVDTDPGDISTIEDEGSVEEAREAWREMKSGIRGITS